MTYSTVAATLSGAGGASYAITEPVSIVHLPYLPAGTFVTSIAAPHLIDSINGGVAAGTLAPVDYDGTGIPTVASGQTGYLVDSIAGSAVSLPSSYGVFLDRGAGATTVTTDPSRSQTVISQAPNFVLNAVGGSGTVLATGGYGRFALTNARETIAVSGPGNVVYAVGGALALSLEDPGNSVALAGADMTIGGNGGNAISITTGNDMVSEGAGSMVQLGSGNASAYVSGGTLIGGTGNAYVSASAKEVVSVGAAGMLIHSFVNDGVTVTNGTGNVIFTSSDYGLSPFAMPSGRNVVLGGQGSITVNGGQNVSDGPGSSASELFVAGTAGRNFITARGEGDVVYGGGDGDLLSAVYGGGSEQLIAGAGAETLTAIGSRFDILVGGSGPNLLFGGYGDTILAGSGAATITTAPSY